MQQLSLGTETKAQETEGEDDVLLTERRLFSVVDVIDDEVGVGSYGNHVAVTRQRLDVQGSLHFSPEGVARLLAIDLIDQEGLANRDTDERLAFQDHEGERRRSLRLRHFDPLSALVVQSSRRDQLDVPLLPC